MSDSTGAGQDGTASTVDKARFDGLMAAYQREKAKADALEKRFAGAVQAHGAEAQEPAGEEPPPRRETDMSDSTAGTARNGTTT